MIQLDRRKDSKWIFQKNVSSKDIITTYVETVNELKNTQAKESIQQRLRERNAYKGRSLEGSLNTLGVRFSQMCFYMFGYKSGDFFVPTKMTMNILDNNTELARNMLVNLFSIQFPHPYSKTSDEFKIYAGRLIIKLLLDERIDKKLYIDEFIYFLPFIKTINNSRYEELVSSIIEFRKLKFEDKDILFKSVDNYIDLFSNCMHECKYYFLKIFQGFGVLELVEEPYHNQGKLFSFKHGKTSTFRRDNISRNYSGYVKLAKEVINDSRVLSSKYSAFDSPSTLADDDVFSQQEWITKLYDIEPLKYLSDIMPSMQKQTEIATILNNMVYASSYGSVDGKDFENSLKPVFELFDKVFNVSVISGSGDTDLLCVAEDNNKQLFKLNIDGKSRSSAYNVNIKRLERHLKKHNSIYCLIVAPKFSPGTIMDIKGEPIVALRADALAKYCSKECLSNNNYVADFNTLDSIIRNHLGEDISPILNRLTENRYGISLR